MSAGTDPLEGETSRWLQAGVSREALDPRRPWGWQVEVERGSNGEPTSVLTVFLVNRECPWRCRFCDLARYTLRRAVRPGDVPAQLDLALSQVREAGLAPRQIKLYNAGSFFDERAIPAVDRPEIARRLADFERVIVECHPHLVGDRVWRFAEELGPSAPVAGDSTGSWSCLELAMGLETCDPAVLRLQGKGMTPNSFRGFARHVVGRGVAVRAFVIIQPPHTVPSEAVHWASRSAEYAVESGASVVSLIPFRAGPTGFPAPSRATVEEAFERSLAVVAGRARVFLDLWDHPLWLGCGSCAGHRLARFRRMNLGQQPEPRVGCAVCEGTSRD